MWEYQFLGVDLYHILSWLYIYSFLGWFWESCYVSVRQKKIINRGFVSGPLCTIYGIGAVSIFLILRPLSDKVFLLYFGGVLAATVLEYVTSLLMETLFHTSWWDYSNEPFNFQGRICLTSSIAWGFFTIMMFKVLHPFVEWIVNLFSIPTGHAMIVIITILYVIDFTFSTLSALKLGQKLKRLERSVSELAEYVQNTKIYSSAEELVERLEPYRRSFNRQNVKEKMDIFQSGLLKRLKREGKEDYATDVKKKLGAVKEQYIGTLTKGGWYARRIMRAYPYLSKATRIRRRRNKKKKLK